MGRPSHAQAASAERRCAAPAPLHNTRRHAGIDAWGGQTTGGAAVHGMACAVALRRDGCDANKQRTEAELGSPKAWGSKSWQLNSVTRLPSGKRCGGSEGMGGGSNMHWGGAQMAVRQIDSGR